MGAQGDIFDPRTNIMTGTRLLRWLANRVDGDLVLTIAGYHAGLGSLAKYGYTVPPYAYTRQYLKMVLDRYYQYKAEESARASASSAAGRGARGRAGRAAGGRSSTTRRRDRQRPGRADPVARGGRDAPRARARSRAARWTRGVAMARARGAIGDGVTLEIGDYRVRVAPAPAGAAAAPPQRTESLARELMREPARRRRRADARGRARPARRRASARCRRPSRTLVIGRGDDANWIILDEDLSRAHAEIRRGWDGVRDPRSRLEERHAGRRRRASRDAAAARRRALELGKVAFGFRDPADRHLRPARPPAAAPAAPSRSLHSSPRSRSRCSRSPASPGCSRPDQRSPEMTPDRRAFGRAEEPPRRTPRRNPRTQ